MFKKIFDFIFGKGGNKTKEKESKQQQTKYQDEGPKPCKISKQERIGILMKAKPLPEEAESFCEEVLKDKNPKTVMWGQMYNEAKAYRRRINEEYPEIFENDTVSPGDMIEVPQGDGKLYVYDAIASWNHERGRFLKFYDKLIEGRDLDDFTFALYAACRFEIATVRNMVRRVLAEIE